jgi:hypothetical protein
MRHSEGAFIALRTHMNEHQCGAGQANGREGRTRTASMGG